MQLTCRTIYLSKTVLCWSSIEIAAFPKTIHYIPRRRPLLEQPYNHYFQRSRYIRRGNLLQNQLQRNFQRYHIFKSVLPKSFQTNEGIQPKSIHGNRSRAQSKSLRVSANLSEISSMDYLQIVGYSELNLGMDTGSWFSYNLPNPSCVWCPRPLHHPVFPWSTLSQSSGLGSSLGSSPASQHY